MGSITCPKCGTPNATPFTCPSCGATFARPLSFDDPKSAVPSPALNKELQLDRRTVPRTPTPQPAPAATTGSPAWLESPDALKLTAPAPPPRPTPLAPMKSALASAVPAPVARTITPPPPPKPALPVTVAPLPSMSRPPPTPPVAPTVAEQMTAPAVKIATPEPLAPAPVEPLRGVQSAEIPIEEIHATPAGILPQLGAWLVDAAVLGTLLAIYLFAAQSIAGGAPPSTETGLDWIVERGIAWKAVLGPGMLLAAALAFVYSSLFHGLGGRTLGKRVFGLTLVDATGMPPNLARSAVRALLAFVSAGALMMGFALVLVDRKRQALHDKLSGTFVVRLAD